MLLRESTYYYCVHPCVGVGLGVCVLWWGDLFVFVSIHVWVHEWVLHKVQEQPVTLHPEDEKQKRIVNARDVFTGKEPRFSNRSNGPHNKLCLHVTIKLLYLFMYDSHVQTSVARDPHPALYCSTCPTSEFSRKKLFSPILHSSQS